MSPEQRKAFDKQMSRAMNRGRPVPPPGAELIEMADHRVYFSTDNWQTAWLIDSYGRLLKMEGQSLHHAQFLAVSQSSWAGNAS